MSNKNAPGDQKTSVPAPASAGAEGALERFIREFNAYEAEANLFARCKDESGFAWWDLARYVVQYALCAEEGIYVAQQAAMKPLHARVASLADQACRLLKDARRVAGLRGGKIDGIYVFRRRPRNILEEIEGSPLPCLVVGDGDAFRPPHVAIDKKSIELFVRVASRFTRPSPAMVDAAGELDREIKARFGSRVDVRRIVLGKYAQHRAAIVAWRWILARTGAVGIVGFIGDDSQKTLVDLANRAGIRTREFQHGYMGASHVNYSYPPLSEVPTTLPAEVMVNRDTGDITYPVARVRSAGSTVAAQAEDPAGGREIDVLIGASPTRAADSFAIASALVDKGLVVAVKLHPNQTVAASGFRDRFTSEQLQVHANEVDFASLARRSSIYVPANPTSTTVFEAVESGARLVVVDYRGAKLTTMIDSIVSERVDSFEQLFGVVRAQLNREAEQCDGN